MSRRTLLSLVTFAAAFAISGCASHPDGGAGATAVPASATAMPSALPEVTAPPGGEAKPDWISELSPRGTAAVGAQIRIRFADDVVPVEALEAPDRQAALSKIEIAPAIPGHFVFVTPRMVTFEAEAPVPKASRIVVTLHAGLADRRGHTLDHDLSYDFRTEPAKLVVTATASDAPQGPRPRFVVTANVRLDEASLADRATLQAPGASPIPLVVAHDATPSPDPDATPEGSRSFDDEPGASYALVPDRDVPLATTYAAVVAPGVKPLLGNVASLDTASGAVRTYAPLAFRDLTLDTTIADRPLETGNPVLRFDNPLDRTSALASVTLSPPAKPGFTLFALDGDDTSIDINPGALQPQTTYTVTVAPALKDRFGQTLGQSATARFATGRLAPELWAPSGFSIFPASARVSLNVATANLPGNHYRAVYRPLRPSQIVATDPSDASNLDTLLGDASTWPLASAPQTPDVESTTQVPLEGTYGAPTGLLAYGVSGKWSTPGQTATASRTVGAVQVTNVGVFAQWFPSGGFVRAQHLNDGGPIANASVEIYESQPADGANAAPCASGRTDATGTLEFSEARLASCLSVATSDDEAPPLVAIVRDGNDWSFARTSSAGAGFDDAYESWSAGTPHSRGTFISDRALYQRGEAASFTGIGYFETKGEIVRGSSKRYAVSMKSPQGTVVDLGSHALDAFGAFALQTTIGAHADLGDWTISATGDGGESFTGTFTVAQFKPPTFKVELALDKTVAVPGESVTAVTTSTYLFGAPVTGGKEHVAVTRQQSDFRPKGYEDYSVGPVYLYPDDPPALAGDVTQADVVTGADGTTSVPVPVGNDLPYPADYRVDADTTDVSNLAVGDTKTFTALPSRDLIALRGAYLGDAGTAFPFDFAVVDPAGKPVSGRAVHFTLARRVYDEATQLVEGSETQRPAAHYVTVAEFDAGSSDRVQHLRTTPDKAGEYRLRANFTGAANEATATDLDIYVGGEGADWYRGDDKTLKIALDKKLYRPGETATALVASPYADADLLFAIVRNDVISKRVVSLHGSSAKIPFVVTSDMLPNAAVEAVLVRRGPSLANGVPAGLKDLSREGLAALHVALDGEYVKVTVAPSSPNVAPGGSQTVKLHVADAGGAPVSAELTVSVANDAVLQLDRYRFPDLVTQVYADEPISTRFADNRADVKLESEHRYVEKGFGYGGGLLAGPAGTRVRTIFEPNAFFDGAVRTDAHGDATVTFTVPDDLTTWRVLATALTRDARFGSADATFVATKPLVTDAILPPFARPGDTLDGGVSVTNVTATAPGADAGDVDVEGSLSGALAFADPAGATVSKKTHFEGRTAGYRFAMAVKAAGRTTPDAAVTFRTALAGAGDAFTVPLPIVSDDVLESVVETGTTTGLANVPLAVDPSLPDDGGLHLTLASTLLGSTLAPLDAALATDGYPFGFESAGRIAVASDRILLERRYGTSGGGAALRTSIAHELELLGRLERSDGSYAFYPNGGADPFTSAFVAVQLVQARAAGVDVGDRLTKLRAYLLGVLADPARGEPSCTADLCRAETRLEALETLAPMGDVRSDHLAEIYALRDKMSYYERVELARQLVRLPEWRDRGIALRDLLLQQLYETGRRAGLVQAADFGETPVDGQAQLLGLMIETHVAPDRIDRAFTSLLQERGGDGTWGCACDDAEAMNAVVLYANRDAVPPAFVATAKVGANSFSQEFAGYGVTSTTRDYPISALPRGHSTVALARGGIAGAPARGTLHYTVDLDYAVRGPAPGAYQGIRIDRIVRPAGGVGDPVAAFGLAAPAAPISVAAGRVFDVEDRITTDHPLDDLVVSDSLAAGLEAIDTRFVTNSAQVFESVSDWNIDYQTIERDRVVTYANALQPGVYAFHYLVRSVTPGTYAWPAARASLALAPDEFGRTAAGTLTVTEP